MESEVMCDAAIAQLSFMLARLATRLTVLLTVNLKCGIIHKLKGVEENE